MSANRVMLGLVIAAVATIAAVTGREALAIGAMTSQPSVSVASSYYAEADFAQRHPELSQAPASDFALRHPEWAITSGGVVADDYALRHADLSAGSVPVDTSDFALRHPEWAITSGGVVTDDYALRHPELNGR